MAERFKPGNIAPKTGTYQNTQRPSHAPEVKKGDTLPPTPKSGQGYTKPGK